MKAQTVKEKPAEPVTQEALAPAKQKTGSRLWSSYRRNGFAIAGSILLCLFVLSALLAPFIAPHDPYEQELRARRLPPFWMERGNSKYLLGADVFGRDILSGIIYGIRISLLVGVVSIAVSVFLGILLGLPSGYYGGRLDAVIMRAADLQFSLPTILMALAMIAIFGRGLFKLILVIGFVGWAEYARTMRGSVIAEREKEYIEAARALGGSDLLIMVKHILPNVLTPIIILIIVQMPRVIVLEATLSFLGLGVPITTPSLGIMIAMGYNYLFSGYWWLTIFPGLALMLIVLSINLLGDWLRDALDPHLHR
ncbi:MAG: ABC transporter permease [Nitrospinota bacterium]|nr:MAG: ABC transporter permease [Nitrospinota bacterium]